MYVTTGFMVLTSSNPGLRTSVDMDDEHTIESRGHIQSEVDELADRVRSVHMQQSPDVSNEQQLQWAGIRSHQVS